MYKARINNTDEIVNASDLLGLYPEYLKLDFVCIDKECSIPMAPCCIKSNEYRRPHFKKYPNKEHIETCEYATLAELYGIGRDQKLSEIQINKVGYPSVFNPDEEKSETEKLPESREENDQEGVTGLGGVSKKYEFDEDNIKFDRRNRVQAIDRIVDWYLGFPYNRDVEIEVYGTKIKYQFFFRKIANNTDPNDLDKVRIFYGKLMLSEKNENVFDRYEDKVFFTLLGHKPMDEVQYSKKYLNYSVKIDKNSISKTRLSKLKNKYNALFEEAYYKHKNKSAEHKVGLYVFVHGEIDKNDNTILNVKKHYITFRYDEVRKTIIEQT